MKKYIVILTLLSFVKVFAQDPIHTQFFMIPETLSSSFTGAKKSTRAGIIHRTQWPGLNFSLNTQFAFVDNWFEEVNSGIGIRHTNFLFLKNGMQDRVFPSAMALRILVFKIYY